jgi:hypothetical protein
MVYQRYTTAIREAHLAEAGRVRAWLDSLDIDPTLRASLVEPIAVVEDAFSGLLRGGRDLKERAG